MSKYYHLLVKVLLLPALVSFPVAAQAKSFVVGTLAYALVAEGHVNVFVQGPVGKRSAVLIDRCDDHGETDVLLFKRYRDQMLQGPYWFGGMIYVKNGDRSGNHVTLGLGYEHTTRKNILLGAFAGGAAGGDSGVAYAVANLTLGYRFN